MTRFNCKECNYRFSMNVEEYTKKCPFCGKDKCIIREPTAENLLDDVMDS